MGRTGPCETKIILRGIPISGIFRRVALVRTDVSEEFSLTSQKVAFFIVTALKTSNLS
jgi:hypothetical protein